ncbi:GM15836 [Drosophila sechellia]|uniref:GM15836 n=1 Tax=Drosophila sechellia TaxID=7238 RepID=B4I7Q4_DROSE|nr:GM15836 [Drosophila sechellia]
MMMMMVMTMMLILMSTMKDSRTNALRQLLTKEITVAWVKWQEGQCTLVKKRRWEVFAVADCQLKLENAMETAAFNSQRAVRRGAPNETERHSHSKTMMSAPVRRDQKDQERHSREHPARADQAGHEQTWPESTYTCRLPHGK